MNKHRVVHSILGNRIQTYPTCGTTKVVKELKATKGTFKQSNTDTAATEKLATLCIQGGGGK